MGADYTGCSYYQSKVVDTVYPGQPKVVVGCTDCIPVAGNWNILEKFNANILTSFNALTRFCHHLFVLVYISHVLISITHSEHKKIYLDYCTVL